MSVRKPDTRCLLRKPADLLLELVYPEQCPLCRRILSRREGLICSFCAGKLKPVSGDICMKCSRPVDEGREYCPDCGSYTHSFSQGRAVFLYEGPVRRSVLSCKYGGNRRFAGFYSQAMTWKAGEVFGIWRPDLLIPVPMHASSLRERGFNLAALLAEGISEGTRVPCQEGILCKTVRTDSQKKLSAQARRSNLAGCFACRSSLQGLRIVLVDDVYTTGSTIDEAARCLLKAGATEVFFLTLCIGRNHN